MADQIRNTPAIGRDDSRAAEHRFNNRDGQTIINGRQYEDLIRHNKTGLIVEPGNAKVLARALAFFISNKSAREKAASNAKAYAEKYLSSETMIKNIESIYQNTNSSEGDHET